MSAIHEIDTAASYAMIRKGAVLIDIREPHEVANKSFDVPETLFIPLRQLGKRFQEIPKNHQVVIACHSGSRSTLATRFLIKQGYRKAVSMERGMIGWERAGLPLKTRPKAVRVSWFKKLFGRVNAVQSD